MLYSIGLSISFLMFVGVLINFIYPLIGISNPISEEPIIATIISVNLFLCIIYYLYNRNYILCINLCINIRKILSCYLLFRLLLALLLPFLAIFGTYLLNFYGNNIILLSLFILVSIIVFISTSKNSSKNSLYSLIVWSVTISILLHWSLITDYIPISDGVFEYYLSNLIIINGIWNPATPIQTNSLIGVTILNPIIYYMCTLNLTSIYKIILPLLMSFVPVTLYEVYSRYYNNNIAILSCFLFVSMFSFFSWIALAIKHVTAYIFVVLIILLMSDKKINSTKRSILYIIFLLSLVVSHYGISCLFMFLVLIVFIYSLIENKILKSNTIILINTTTTFVVLYAIFAISWYIWTSNSSVLEMIADLGSRVANAISEFSLESSPASKYVNTSLNLPLSLQIRKFIYYLLLIFEIVGVFDLIYKSIYKKIIILDDYLSVSAISFILNFTIFIPVLPISFSIDRIFNFTAIFLSPFCVKGAEITVRAVSAGILQIKMKDDTTVKLLSLFFIIFMLFETGIISGFVVKDFYFSSALSKSDIITSGSFINKNRFYSDYMIEYDVIGARWLSTYRISPSKIYSDYLSQYPLVAYGRAFFSFNESQSDIIILEPQHMKENIYSSTQYIYFRYSNIIDGIMVYNLSLQYYDIKTLTNLKMMSNKIYYNGGCEIYAVW